jgi:hypothetical protein
MQNSILVEPEATYTGRHANAQEDMFAFLDADPHIVSLLRFGPTHMMKVVNVVGRALPSRSKRQRVAIKRETLLRLGVLIRRGQLRRIKRKFVALPAVRL